jgi:TDG/mug DNA glycosylase family protein
MTRARAPRRPTAEDLAAAECKRIRDVLAPGLSVIFCGINPSLYSAAVGHHFARPGNRFWPALFHGGFTDRLLTPAEERALLGHGCGLTNLVARATRTAEELDPAELRAGRARLARIVRRLRPRCIAFLGIGAYRVAFGRAPERPGPAGASFHGARVWVLPNPSGRTAHYRPADFARLFAALRADASGKKPPHAG